MANLKHLSWALVVVMALMVVAPEVEAVISCGQVTQKLISCLDYLRSGGSGMVSPECCNGVKSLNDAAKTTSDRRAVCGCLKSAASAAPNVNIGVAASIPGKCGVNLPYKLDPTIDCTKVH